ncbi:integrase catalytic domain-containing protein [Trichonephila clavipes]|nr:integrase catalytic domain-containing protein [Trichonephila clavipes]
MLGKIFDPIGFLGPFTLRIYENMVSEWDESLSDDKNSLWAAWCEEVPQLTDFSIPRCYFSDSLVNNFKALELHLFSDTNTKAYGTVAYLRVTSSNKEILTSFVASKNRIVPLKTLTLPRLEFMGALLSAGLSSNILKALKLNIPCFFWTDSKITHCWVRGGVKISRLLNDTSWLQGAEWLRLPPEFWPESKKEDSPNSPDLEYKI